MELRLTGIALQHPHPPRILDASALVTLRAGLRRWEPLLLFRGVHSMDLTEHAEIEIGGMLTSRSGVVAVLGGITR